MANNMTVDRHPVEENAQLHPIERLIIITAMEKLQGVRSKDRGT